MRTRFIIILSVLAGMFSSCKVNDIALYSESQRIEFSSSEQCSFNDIDYLNAYILDGEDYKNAEFTAQLIGYFLDTPRTFAVMTSPVTSAAFTPEVEFTNPYEFPAGVPSVTAGFKVKCPSKENVSTRNTTRTGVVDIVYDNSSEFQQFGEGRVENLSCEVSVTLNIYPSDWDNTFWGAYSTSKYFLIMETFGAVHADIERTVSNKLMIMAAYNDYKAQNGPLFGDDNDSNKEIVFPS